MQQKNHFFLIAIFIIFSTFQVGCTPNVYRFANKTSNSYEIRVHLKTATFPIEIDNKYICITDSLTGKVLKTKGDKILLTTDNGHTYINSRQIQTPIIIKSSRKYPITINGKIYFGFIKVFPTLNPQVINYIPIETYLMSVVSSEVPSTFEIDALEAQTIIARTYSYYFIKKNHEQIFDVDDTTAYQVYNGYKNLCDSNSASRRIFRAISSTKNIIITYQKQPILAYFHANSGGKTKSGASYFGPTSDFPYLVAHDDPYSVDQPAYSWSFSVSSTDFERMFGQNAIINQTNFCQSISNETKTFDTKTIRKMIGYSKVKSETFTITKTDKEIKFVGFGYGHGVGMSQWGANKMAKDKFDFKEIIDFYYPCTKLNKF